MTIEDGRQPVPEKELDQQVSAGSDDTGAVAAPDDAGEAAAAAAAESELPPAEAAAPDAPPTLDEVRTDLNEVVPDRQVKVGDVVLYHVSQSDEPATKHNAPVILPAVVTAVWGPACANLKIFTDGPMNTWKSSAMHGDGPGNWSFRD